MHTSFHQMSLKCRIKTQCDIGETLDPLIQASLAAAAIQKCTRTLLIAYKNISSRWNFILATQSQHRKSKGIPKITQRAGKCTCMFSEKISAKENRGKLYFLAFSFTAQLDNGDCLEFTHRAQEKTIKQSKLNTIHTSQYTHTIRITYCKIHTTYFRHATPSTNTHSPLSRSITSLTLTKWIPTPTSGHFAWVNYWLKCSKCHRHKKTRRL